MALFNRGRDRKCWGYSEVPYVYRGGRQWERDPHLPNSDPAWGSAGNVPSTNWSASFGNPTKQSDIAVHNKVIVTCFAAPAPTRRLHGAAGGTVILRTDSSAKIWKVPADQRPAFHGRGYRSFIQSAYQFTNTSSYTSGQFPWWWVEADRGLAE